MPQPSRHLPVRFGMDWSPGLMGECQPAVVLQGPHLRRIATPIALHPALALLNPFSERLLNAYRTGGLRAAPSRGR